MSISNQKTLTLIATSFKIAKQLKSHRVEISHVATALKNTVGHSYSQIIEVTLRSLDQPLDTKQKEKIQKLCRVVKQEIGIDSISFSINSMHLLVASRLFFKNKIYKISEITTTAQEEMRRGFLTALSSVN